MLHHPTGVSWVLLSLSRRQYKVYEKKISPKNKETLKFIENTYIELSSTRAQFFSISVSIAKPGHTSKGEF